MDFQYFAKSSLYFQHHLQFQGLHHFLSIHTPYFQDLIKVFYSNLTLTEDGHLYTEVNKTKIHIKPTDWLTLAGLKYEGIKLNLPDIPDDLDYDRATALTSMTRPHMQGRYVRNVGSLMVNDTTTLGWQHILNKKYLKKLNVVKVNGVWQHGTVHRDDDENAHDEDQPMPDDHVADIRQQSPVQHDSQMLSQIWTYIQRLQEGLNNLNITVNTGGYDMGNHFAEYAGFDCDYDLYPNMTKQYHFLRHYLKPERPHKLSVLDSGSVGMGDLAGSLPKSVQVKITHDKKSCVGLWGQSVLLQVIEHLRKGYLWRVVTNKEEDPGCYKKRVLFKYKGVNMKLSYLGMVALTIFSSSLVLATRDLSPPLGEAQPQPRLVRRPRSPPYVNPSIPVYPDPSSRPLRSSYFSHLHGFSSPSIPHLLIAPASSYSTTLVDGASR
ncbi:hypothetical protein Fmac_026445 [Flemingia macrophylla]|uniref:Uncharacterized protein n=1 Tax=Flemingia macrophylla TaxID=520843 RepID=A0ABD1LF18_9FABA